MEINRTTAASTAAYDLQRKTNDTEKEEKELAQGKADKKDGADQFIKSKGTEEGHTYSKVKKLTKEQVEALREQKAQAQQEMLKKMMRASISNQANNYGMSQESQDLITEIFGSFEAGLPPIATTPEEAQKAIEPGGAYSVEAVADRIMKMAKALAGEDPEKIKQMKEAVKKGFEMAGLDFEKMTGKQKLPQICLDTYDEVMRQFEEWEK